MSDLGDDDDNKEEEEGKVENDDNDGDLLSILQKLHNLLE